MEVHANLHLQNSNCQHLPLWRIPSSRQEPSFEKLTTQSSESPSSRATPTTDSSSTNTRSAMAKAISKFAVRRRGYSSGTSFTSLSMMTSGSSECGCSDDHFYVAFHDDEDCPRCQSDRGVIDLCCKTDDESCDDCNHAQDEECYWTNGQMDSSTRCCFNASTSPSTSPCRSQKLLRRHSCDSSSCSSFSPTTPNDHRAAQLEFLGREKTSVGVRVVWIPLDANIERRADKHEDISREQVLPLRPSLVSARKKPLQQATKEQGGFSKGPVRGLRREKKYRNLSEFLET